MEEQNTGCKAARPGHQEKPAIGCKERPSRGQTIKRKTREQSSRPGNEEQDHLLGPLSGDQWLIKENFEL